MPIFGDNTSGVDKFPCNVNRALLDQFSISENGCKQSISVFFCTNVKSLR